jgi:tRNA-splicing ligase RtcB
MSVSRLQGESVRARLWIPVEEVEAKALQQLKNIASLPWVAHVAVMPDVHYGIGATVGAVIAMRGAVSPAAVGVDIGCGMGAMRTNLTASDLPESLARLRSAIERDIPVGFAAHSRPALERTPGAEALRTTAAELFEQFDALDGRVRALRERAALQLGTLGGGNHFIELCLDTEQRVWLLLHSGSRNIGKSLAELHIESARRLAHNAQLPDPDLSVFLAGTPEMKAYRHDLFWAQRYALLNRQVMFALYQSVLRGFFPQVRFEAPVLCHHNYVAEEVHHGEGLMVTRKGAISARAGELGIIPGSMGTRSYIVRGLGNAESLTSASHGAGRSMSRGEAKRRFKVEDLRAQTQGVECRKDAGVLDEIPGAYKDIDRVMALQRDLVEVVAELKQVLTVKG